MSVVRVKTADGVDLVVRRVRATAARTAVLVCGHAMMANGRYFGDADGGFAATLAARGVDVYIVDWRGHGASCPPSPRNTAWSFMAYVEEDLPAVLRAVAVDAACDESAICYLGHSLGGLVGLAALGQTTISPLRRLVLAATSVWTGGPTGPFARRVAIEVFRYSAIVMGRVPVRGLGQGTDDENRCYARELSDWVRKGKWTTPTGVDLAMALPELALPTLAIVATADRLCRPEDARQLHGKMPNVVRERLVGIGCGDALDSDHFGFLRNRAFTSLWHEIAAFVAE